MGRNSSQALACLLFVSDNPRKEDVDDDGTKGKLKGNTCHRPHRPRAQLAGLQLGVPSFLLLLLLLVLRHPAVILVDGAAAIKTLFR